jgi:phosphatidylserine/phosphatidylglycerophosphate/cardiolipin synthase-like enzyme
VEDSLFDSIDGLVVAAIDSARRTVDVVSFDLNLPSVVNALLRAQRRGVAVRIVADQKNGSAELTADARRPNFDARFILEIAKVPLVDGGRTNGLMHHKFILIDGNQLFVGSWNVSWNDTYRNNNNILRITDRTIIALYAEKFEEMFSGRRFGTKSVLTGVEAPLNLGGVPVEVYFAPKSGVMRRIVLEVERARRTVNFMAFTYTWQPLAEAMIARANARVRVQGVYELRGASQGTMPRLHCANVPVRLDGNRGTMHHKVIIIDGETVITGSYNFTSAADKINDENVIIIRNREVAAAYQREFAKRYEEGAVPVRVDCAAVAAGIVASTGPACPDLDYSCAQLTCAEAAACLAAGNERLDQDGDGLACNARCGG